jgi:hypothetical protein
MSTSRLKEQTIRSGIVRHKSIGYVLMCNPELEERQPHATLIKYDHGKIQESLAKFNAHSLCLIHDPELALVFISSEGFYGIHSKESTAGNIFENSSPQPTEPRYGSIRSISEINGKAYAVGLRGIVYRLDTLPEWTRIDSSELRDFDIQAIHGFDDSEIYAAGMIGELWKYDGNQWTKIEIPTNINLTAIKCCDNGFVYIAGHKGMLLRGRDNHWEVMSNEQFDDDIWGIEWFGDRLYLSTMSSIYMLDGESIIPIEFTNYKPLSFYQLSCADEVLWSIGENDIAEFDGDDWHGITL